MCFVCFVTAIIGYISPQRLQCNNQHIAHHSSQAWRDHRRQWSTVTLHCTECRRIQHSRHCGET